MASTMTVTVDLYKLAVEMAETDHEGLIDGHALAYGVRVTLQQIGRSTNAEEMESRGYEFCAPVILTGRHDDDAAPSIGTVKFS